MDIRWRIFWSTFLSNSLIVLVLALLIEGRVEDYIFLFFFSLIGLTIGLFLSYITSSYFSKEFLGVIRSARNLVKATGVKGTKRAGLKRIRNTMNEIANELKTEVSFIASERNQFGRALEEMGQGVVSIDDQGKVQLCNPAFSELLNTAPLVPGENFLDKVNNKDLKKLISEALQGKVVSKEITLRDPKTKVLFATASHNETNADTLLVINDISRLIQLETVRSDFIGNVSHELRTPISVLSATAETILTLEDNQKKDLQYFTSAIVKNADRMRRIVDDLLYLARIEAGEFPIDIKKVKILDNVSSVALNYDDILLSKNIKLELDQSLNIACSADIPALELVISNFLSNAIAYSPEGGTIKIFTKENSGRTKIYVQDQGPGIPKKYHARVFERFFRVDKGRSLKEGGTGLGLSIAKNLSKLMYGSVGVENLQGKEGGSRFWIELPS